MKKFAQLFFEILLIPFSILVLFLSLIFFLTNPGHSRSDFVSTVQFILISIWVLLSAWTLNHFNFSTQFDFANITYFDGTLFIIEALVFIYLFKMINSGKSLEKSIILNWVFRKIK